MKVKILICIIFLIAFVARFYHLGLIPDGLAQDETSIGYNAYSILKTGKDEYGKSYPISFKAFGEYKLPGYIYLSVPSIAVFGTTAFGVRFPSAVFGFLTVFLFYFFVKKLTKDEKLSIIATALLAINPWHIHFSRAAFEVVPALFFMLLGAYVFLLFIDSKKYFSLMVSACCFVFSLYIYNICKVLSPLLFIMLLFVYRKEIPLKKPTFWISFTPALFLLIPFFIDVFTSGGYTSTEGTLLYSSAVVQAPLLEVRSSVLLYNSLLATVFFNKWIQTSYVYFQHIASYFSPSFLFISGSDHGNHGIGNVGMFYLFEFITMAAGLIAYIKKQHRWLTLLLLWAGLTILVASYTREAPHATRAFFLIPPLIILSAFGISTLFSIVQKIFQPLRLGIFAASILFAGYCIVYYFSSYYFHFPIVYGASWRSQDPYLIAYIVAHQQDYDQIIFDNASGFIYTSLLYYLPYDPGQFQSTVTRGPDDSEGFSKVHSFSKYVFTDVNWDSVRKQHKTLVVTKSEKLPSGIASLRVFNYRERPVAEVVGQQIFQFPAKDEAYAVVEIK